MKTAVSVPNEVFDDGERLAARLGWTRSKLYSTALQAYIAATDDTDEVTAALDRLTGEGDEPGPYSSGRELIADGLWEW